jgi:hypothetical protein
MPGVLSGKVRRHVTFGQAAIGPHQVQSVFRVSRTPRCLW